MLRKLFPLYILLMIAGWFSSCDEEFKNTQQKGELEFSIRIVEKSDLLKSLKSDSLPDYSTYQLLITVVDEKNETVFEDKMIKLIPFGNSFLSEKIEMTPGTFLLTKFLVINPKGIVIYAAPLEGSSMSYLVTNPLPVSFQINPEIVTTLRPEVLVVGEEPPEAFGYTSFRFYVVRPLTFYVSVYLDNPLLMAPSALTDAQLRVISTNGWEHTYQIEPTVNKIIIRKGAANYTLIVMKEGYPTRTYSFSAAQLQASSPDNPLLLVIGESPYDTLILQPGPEKGKDAMIMDLKPFTNFGDYPYFEATYMSEPILTVMRTTRSLIYFNIYEQLPPMAVVQKVTLTLSFDLQTWEIINTNGNMNPDIRWDIAILQQIVEPWNEHEVTWDNQPKPLLPTR